MSDSCISLTRLSHLPGAGLEQALYTSDGIHDLLHITHITYIHTYILQRIKFHPIHPVILIHWWLFISWAMFKKMADLQVWAVCVCVGSDYCGTKVHLVKPSHERSRGRLFDWFRYSWHVYISVCVCVCVCLHAVYRLRSQV